MSPVVADPAAALSSSVAPSGPPVVAAASRPSAPTPPGSAIGISPVAWGVFPALLLLAFVGALFWHSNSVIAFKDSASAVAYTTGAALVIERLIEGIWTMVSSLGLGNYWPMRNVMHYAEEVESKLNGALTNFVAAADQELDRAGAAAQVISAQVASLRADVAAYQAEIDALKAKSPPGSQQTLLLTSAISLRINYLQAKYAGTLQSVGHAAAVSGTLVSGLQNFVATFKDNPGRRLISLCLGGLMGIVAAACLGLDLFSALTDVSSASPAHPLVVQGMRFALTGFVIGLGSGPTHEVIRLLQEFKQTRKGQNASQPDQP